MYYRRLHRAAAVFESVADHFKQQSLSLNTSARSDLIITKSQSLREIIIPLSLQITLLIVEKNLIIFKNSVLIDVGIPSGGKLNDGGDVRGDDGDRNECEELLQNY